METNVNYTIVGAFVIILFTAIVLAIIWLSSGFSFHRYTTYKIYMQESVTGLSQDAPVEFNGVNVGSVERIKINKKNPQLVEVLLSINNATPITRGTVATLNTKGVTGITFVALKDKSTDLRLLKPAPGQHYAVIPTVPSLFMRIDTALNQITTNFRDVSESIQKLLNKQNLQSIQDTLANLKLVTQNLAENNKKLTVIFDNTSKFTAQMTPFINSGTTAMRMLETQTLPITYQMMSNLENATRTLNEMALEIKQDPSILLRGVERQGLGPGENKCR